MSIRDQTSPTLNPRIYATDDARGANCSSLLSPPLTNLWGWWNASNCYDASPGGNLITADSSSVVRMLDLSGNGRDLVQATAGNRGTFQINQINTTLPCLRLTADASRWYTTAAAPVDPLTIYTVAKSTTWSLYSIATNVDSVVWAAYGFEQSPSANWVQHRYDAGTITDGTGSIWTLNTWHCGIQVVNGASSILKINNNADRTGTLTTHARQFFRIGYGGTYSVKQDFAESLVYSAAHATASGNGLLVREYLQARFGFAWGI